MTAGPGLRYGILGPLRTADLGGLDVDWRTGVAATALDLEGRQVELADGTSEGFEDFAAACVAGGAR